MPDVYCTLISHLYRHDNNLIKHDFIITKIILVEKKVVFWPIESTLMGPIAILGIVNFGLLYSNNGLNNYQI